MSNLVDKVKAQDRISPQAIAGILEELEKTYTGNANNESALANRRIDFSKIPDYELIKKILPTWLGGRQATIGTGPAEGYTYGDYDENLNVPGETRVKNQDVGLQASTYLGSLLGQPKDLGTLAHELTHVYQGKKIRRNAVDDQKEKKDQQNNLTQFQPFFENLMATTPTAYNLKSPKNEIEATTFGGLMRNLMEVKRQEEHQQKFAPELRPK